MISRLRFGSLNHAPGDAINPLRPVKADSNTVIYFRFRGGLCCKTPKLQCQEFFAKTRSGRRSPISYTLSRGAEIAGEFNARGSVPSRLYTEDAPTARGIFDHLCKTTFATQSGAQPT